MDLAEIFAKIGFDWKIALFNVLNFSVFAFILWKLFFTKIRNTLEERQRIITEGIEHGEQAKIELNNSKANAQKILTAAQTESQKILQQAVTRSEQVAAQLRAQAEEEIAVVKLRADKQLQLEKQQQFKEIKDNLATLVLSASNKLMATKSADMNDTKKVENYLSGLDLDAQLGSKN